MTPQTRAFPLNVAIAILLCFGEATEGVAQMKHLDDDHGLLVYSLPSNLLTGGLLDFKVGFRNIDTREITRLGKNNGKKPVFAQLPAGRYRLEYVDFDTLRACPPVDREFRIAAGEATYIGDIRYMQKVKLGGEFILSIADNFEAALPMISHDWPSLPVRNLTIVLEPFDDRISNLPRSPKKKDDAESLRGLGFIAFAIQLDKPSGFLALMKGDGHLNGLGIDLHRDGGFRRFMPSGENSYYASKPAGSKAGSVFVVVYKTMPGKHFIDNFTLFLPNDDRARYTDSLLLDFEVYPDRVTYLGQLQIRFDPDSSLSGSKISGVRPEATDQWESNRPIFERTHRNMSFDDASIQILEIPQELPKLEAEQSRLRIIMPTIVPTRGAVAAASARTRRSPL